VDAERPRFVRGRRDHLPASGGVAGASDDDRETAQLRPPPDFDRRDELVEVDVQDPGAHPIDPARSL
jgi:hypothetical protein